MTDKKYTFVVDPERLTLDDLIELEESGGQISMRRARDLLSDFLVNGSGEYVPKEDAIKVVGGFNLLEVRDAVDQFIAAANLLGGKLVPEASGSSS